MRLAQAAAIEKARTVAIQRPSQFARNFTFDFGRFVAPAAFRTAEQHKAARRRLRAPILIARRQARIAPVSRSADVT
jgi:hypothetical protein